MIPCSLGNCAAPADHDGDCAHASGWADDGHDAATQERVAAVLFRQHGGRLSWADVKYSHPILRAKLLRYAAEVLAEVKA